jgi:hypothetical protein
MKARKAGRGTRRAAQSASRAAPARPATTSEPRVTGLERDGEIRLNQLLRALTGAPISRIKPAH